MTVTLDGQILFDRQNLQIETDSFIRASIEKTVSSLNGVLSIDLGRRGRQIKQKGMLQAKSRTLLDKRIAAISAFMDGDTHELATNSGEEFDNLRMDVFKVSQQRSSSVGVAVDYEIVYTQLT